MSLQSCLNQHTVWTPPSADEEVIQITDCGELLVPEHPLHHILNTFSNTFLNCSHTTKYTKYLLPLTTMPAFIFKFKLLIHIIIYLDWLGSLLFGIFLLIIYKVNYSNLWHNKLLPAPLANLEPPRPPKCVRTQIQPLHCHAATLQNR